LRPERKVVSQSAKQVTPEGCACRRVQEFCEISASFSDAEGHQAYTRNPQLNMTIYSSIVCLLLLCNTHPKYPSEMGWYDVVKPNHSRLAVPGIELERRTTVLLVARYCEW
jgi:hypothetical protein